jgi:hypothetical protein
LKVFLGELILYKIFFVAIKTVIYTQTLKAFLDFTFSVIEQGKPHEIAAAPLVERFNTKYVYRNS